MSSGFVGRANHVADCRPTGGTVTLQCFLLRRVFCSAIDIADRRPAGGAQCCHPEFFIADSPYFHPHSLWSSCSGASWVYSIWNGCCRLGRELTLCFQRVVLRRRRSHPNSAIWFSSFRLPLLSAASVNFDFAAAHTPHRLPTADEAGCPACAQRLQPLSSLHACRLVLPGVAPSVSGRYRVRDG